MTIREGDVQLDLRGVSEVLMITQTVSDTKSPAPVRHLSSCHHHVTAGHCRVIDHRCVSTTLVKRRSRR